MKPDRIAAFLVMLFITLSLAGPARAGFPVPGPAAKGGEAQAAPRTLPFRNMTGATAGQRKYRDGAILVKFKPDLSEGAKKGLHRRHGSTVSKRFDRIRLHHVKLKKGISVEDALQLYAADPGVEYAEPDLVVQSLATPSDPGFGSLWGMNRIAAPQAWDLSTGSSSVVVAVLDTGIDYNHPDLAANIWVNPVQGRYPGFPNDIHGIDTLNGDSDPFDDHFHGTHVSGTIGAVGNNGLGVVGVNWKVQLLACKFLGANGSGYLSGAIECLDYVRTLKDQGVNIVATNNSWGAVGVSQGLSDAIAAQGDILFIAAAGNDASNIDKTQAIPGGYDLPNLISVAATDGGDALAYFSNSGPNSVLVGAPGTDIYSTAPGNAYQYLQGTSMAAPHVTGLAALLSSTGKDWKQVKNLIISGGDPVPALKNATVTGRRINAFNSLSCSGRTYLALPHLPGALQAGVPVTLSALSINCGEPAGPVTVTLPGGATLQLKDDGSAPDTVAGDGVFKGSWTPAGPGAVPVTFSSPAGSLTVAVPPVGISATSTVAPPASASGSLVSAPTGVYYSQTFAVTGGIAPFTWSILSGALPDGLSLNGTSGEISGTPGSSGAFAFTVRVADALGGTGDAPWSIVLNQGLVSGWPKTLRARTPDSYALTSSPVFADLDGDGKQEIIVTDLNTLYVLDQSGVIAHYDFPSGSKVFSTPAVADLFNDGKKEIVVSLGYPSQTAPIYAFDSTLHLLPGFPAGGFPFYFGSPGFCGTPTVADLNSDGNKTILVDCAPNNLYDPNGGKNVLLMVDPRGAMVSGWPVLVGAAPFENEPNLAVADLYRDGKKEVVLLGGDGVVRIYRKDATLAAQWSAAANPTGVWPPVLADFDGDGFLELAVKQLYDKGDGSSALRLSLFDRFGVLQAGWPREYPWVPSGGIIAADLTGDGHPKIIANTGPNWDQWNAFQADGTQLANWPLPSVGGWIDSNAFPVAGGFSSSSSQDLVFSLDDHLWGYAGSGSPLAGFPKFTSAGVIVRSSPALGDLDGNGRLDIAVKANDGTLHVFSSDHALTGQPHWPMYGHDAQHTGTLPVQDLLGIPVPDFYASTLAGLAPQAVSFTDTSSNAPSSWAWDFGDGGVSTLKNPSHSYAVPGSYTVSLNASNVNGGASETKVALVSVYAAATLTPPALQSGSVGAAYRQQLSAVGVPSAAWSLSSGSLPAGLALNGATGALTGTPAASGSASFTVRAAGSGASASRDYTLTVYPVPVISTASLAPGFTGTLYRQTLAGSGGKTPYLWSVIFNGQIGAAQSQLPAGLALDNFAGVISGVPAGVVSDNVRIVLTDANGATATQDFTLSVSYTPPSIATTQLPAAGTGRSYSQQIAVTGGVAPYTWSVSSGALPSGLALDGASGVISGLASSVGTSGFTVRVTDGNGSAATRALSLRVQSVLTITTASLPPAYAGRAYSQAVSAQWGSTPYLWSVASGALPAGLSLDGATGVISGTASGVGSAPFTLQVRDAVGATDTRQLSLVVAAPPVITTALLASTTQYANYPYSQTLTASGGTLPYSWSVSAGSLPDGLTLNGVTGVISGPYTPSVGTFGLTVQVTDAGGMAATRAFSILVYPTLGITTPSLSSATVGVSYRQSVATSGGQPPITWTSLNGTLPAGLALDGSSGVISGTPTAPGTSGFWICVRDVNSASTCASYSIVVDPPSHFPVWLSGGFFFTLIGDAYAQAADQGTIKVEALDFGGDLLFNRDVRVALMGGYDTAFTANSAATGLLGRLRVANGTAQIDKLRFK